MITIGIKALNEETHIGQCLGNALKAVEPFGGAVILADSGSSDRTIAIAQKFPVEIRTLKNPSERRCGAGAQLAFEGVTTEFFYILDGDMIISPDFLPAAISFLQGHPEFAGVGGRVREVNKSAHEFEIRAQVASSDENWRPGIVDRLDCGGLYRVAAIRDVGYFADRNLHSFEEFELAARLTTKGWKLARIDVDAVNHYGHSVNGYTLLARRWRSGYAAGAGEVLRAALGQPHLFAVISRLAPLKYAFVVYGWWMALIIAGAVPLAPAPKIALCILLMVLPPIVLIYRRRSMRLGLFSFVSWNVAALGVLKGLFAKRATSSAVPFLRLQTPSCTQASVAAVSATRDPSFPHTSAP